MRHHLAHRHIYWQRWHGQRRHWQRWAAIVVLLGAGYGLIWLGGGMSVLGPVQRNAAQTYGVVFLSPSRLGRLMHPFMQQPGVVQLVRTDTWQVVRSSGVVDLFGNGQIVWAIRAAGAVAVGADVRWQQIPVLPGNKPALAIPSR